MPQTVITDQEAQALLPSLIAIGGGGDTRTTTTVYAESYDAPVRLGSTVRWDTGVVTWWKAND